MITTATTREATFEELVARVRYTLGDSKVRLRYRHFVMELPNPRAANGVSHRQYSNAKPYIRDGKVYVRHHGKEEQITGTWYESPGLTHGIVTDVRIKSEHLPTNV